MNKNEHRAEEEGAEKKADKKYVKNERLSKIQKQQ